MATDTYAISTSKISPYQMGTAKAQAAAEEILQRLRVDYVVSARCGPKDEVALHRTAGLGPTHTKARH